VGASRPFLKYILNASNRLAKTVRPNYTEIQSRHTQDSDTEDILAQIDAVFENFFERVRLVDLFANDSLDPVEYFLLLLRFAALARKTALSHVNIHCDRPI